MKSLLILTLILIFTLSANAQMARASSDISLRGTPDLRGKVVENLSSGANLEILKKQGAWVLVQSKDYAGWVLAENLKIREESENGKLSKGQSVAKASLSTSPASRDKAVLSGIIYFTNNTPSNRDTFPVELFTADQKKLVSGTTPSHGTFEFKDIEPGKYILKLTWADFCILLYRIDLTRKLKIEATIVMDAACSNSNAKPRDLPQRFNQ